MQLDTVIMAKRSGDAADGHTSSKKRRVADESEQVLVQNADVPVKDEEDQRKREKKEKKERKRKAKELAANGAADPVEKDEADEPTTKEERKKQKKEKKRQKELADEAGANEKIIEPATVALEDMDDGEAKKKVPAHLSVPVATGQSGPLTLGGYQQNSDLSALPQKNIDDFLAEQFITISDPLNSGFRPITEFKYLPTGADAKHLEGFKAPSPIQAASWPFLLAGRDAIGIAETGSGKTMAFGVPCMRYVRSVASSGKKGGSRVRAVMVSPTRELAVQIYEQLVKLVGDSGIKVVCVYGGVPKDEQRNGLRTASIIVATPGRLNDFIQEGAADLSNVGYFVLDEADRMLDKGFEAEIKKIASTITAGKAQTVMFTATWPQSIRELAASFMKDPVRINIGQDNPTGDLRANIRVKQEVEVVDPRGKEQRLLALLKQYQSGKDKDNRILVFCLYKKEATRVEGYIASKGLRVAGIHGDLNQNQRSASLEAFKSGKVPLLVATDVAARGLDIPNVKVVINVTFPLTVEDYVHRIGRTGRAGQDGLAITLFTEHDKAQSGALINVLKAAKQPVPDELMKFGTVRTLRNPLF